MNSYLVRIASIREGFYQRNFIKKHFSQLKIGFGFFTRCVVYNCAVPAITVDAKWESAFLFGWEIPNYKRKICLLDLSRSELIIYLPMNPGRARHEKNTARFFVQTVDIP